VILEEEQGGEALPIARHGRCDRCGSPNRAGCRVQQFDVKRRLRRTVNVGVGVVVSDGR
jgi:hypothetical protein